MSKRIVIPGNGVADVAAGPGGMWFSALQPKQAGRVTPAGVVKQFTLPIKAIDNSAGGNNIVSTAGSVWIAVQTTSESALARVAPSGKGTIVGLGMPTAPGKDAVAAIGARGRMISFGVWWNRSGTISTSGTLGPSAGEANGFPKTAAALGWAADRSGAMWFVYGRGYGKVAGQNVTTWEPSDGRAHEFRDITLGPDGNMWVADNENAVGYGVGRVAPDGTLKELELPGGPWSITAGPDKNIWVSLPYRGIARVTPAGKITVYTGLGANPSAIASGFGKLWLVTDNAGAIYRIDVPKK